jgi:Zn-dependent membrane protease YugP
MFKIITGTFLATLFLMSVSAKLFLMPLLGLFDLAAVPVSQLAELNASKKMVKKMESRHKNLQKRHEVKKQRVTKKFVKNSTKKNLIGSCGVSNSYTISSNICCYSNRSWI